MELWRQTFARFGNYSPDSSYQCPCCDKNDFFSELVQWGLHPHILPSEKVFESVHLVVIPYMVYGHLFYLTRWRFFQSFEFPGSFLSATSRDLQILMMWKSFIEWFAVAQLAEKLVLPGKRLIWQLFGTTKSLIREEFFGFARFLCFKKRFKTLWTSKKCHVVQELIDAKVEDYKMICLLKNCWFNSSPIN